MSADWLNILQQLAYTLGHFLWQGLVIALTLKLCLTLIDKNHAQLRYLCSIVALIACCVAPIYTFTQLMQASPATAASQTLPWVQDLVQSTQHMIFSQGLIKSLQVSHLLAISWLLIVSVLLVKFIIEFSWAQSIRRQQILAPTHELQDQFLNLVARLNLDRKVQLLLSFHISSPMTLGLFKPVIMLPAQLVTGLNKEQLELVLLHELIHIQRFDYAVNLCQAIIELLLFFHPAVHWMGRQIRLERECICDQKVLSYRQDTLQYARLMTDLADYHQSSSDLAIAANGGELTQRVERMLNDSRRPSQLNSIIPVTFIAALFASVSGLSASSVWQAVIDSSSTQAKSQATENQSQTLAQSSIAHWLLNPEQSQVQTSVTANSKQVQASIYIDENPVDAIKAELTQAPQADELATLNVARERKELTAAKKQTNLEPSQEEAEPSKQTSATTLVAENKIADDTDSEAQIAMPVPELVEIDEPRANQMTVFAKKAEKQVVLPVIELQDDLSGQAQLINSTQLIAQTYPNVQEQAEIIEAQVLKTYAPKYPKLAARRKLSKAVQVSFVIDVAGRVTQLDFKEDRQVRYFKGSISEAMKKWRFKPATINGKPVESSMTKIFDFNLEG